MRCRGIHFVGATSGCSEYANWNTKGLCAAGARLCKLDMHADIHEPRQLAFVCMRHAHLGECGHSRYVVFPQNVSHSKSMLCCVWTGFVLGVQPGVSEHE